MSKPRRNAEAIALSDKIESYTFKQKVKVFFHCLFAGHNHKDMVVGLGGKDYAKYPVCTRCGDIIWLLEIK